MSTTRWDISGIRFPWKSRCLGNAGKSKFLPMTTSKSNGSSPKSAWKTNQPSNVLNSTSRSVALRTGQLPWVLSVITPSSSQELTTATC
jgi:hypothetical protein